MRKASNKKTDDHASLEQLSSLLYGDEESPTTVEISLHVETCAVCQTRLQDIDAFSEVAQEISTLLSSGFELEAELSNRWRHRQSNSHPRTNVNIDNAANSDEVKLGPPSHPEMLGRLGRYEIERKIGSGGMGIVFKAFDTELNRPVAIKVLAPYLARNGAARQRFGRESRAAAAVVHEHVVAIHNVESDGETPFIVMQYVSGESLQARVQRLGPLSVEEILRIGIQTAAGLAAAHEQGIVHRDVKPENILLENSVDRVLLTDFGLARTVDDASLTHTGVIAGTPSYMSPEQANGDGIDHRTDLFSFGSVLYFIATGHPPFRAERAMGVLHRICTTPHRPVWQVNAKIPQELSQLIDRLLEKNPAKRVGSAHAVRETLTRILAKVQSGRPAIGLLFNTWFHRHQRAVTSAALGVFAIALISTAVLLTRSKSPSPGDSAPVVKQLDDTLIKNHVSSPDTMSLGTALGTSDRVEFDRNLGQINAELDRLDAVPRETMEADRWNEELRAIGRALNEIGKSD